MFVKDVGAIPDNHKVTQRRTCSAAHNGVCQFEDKELLKPIGSLTGRLHTFAFDPENKEGDLFVIASRIDVRIVVEQYVFLAFRRYKDPKLVVFIGAVKGPDGIISIVLDRPDRCFEVLHSTRVAKAALQPEVISVKISKIGFSPVDCASVRPCALGPPCELIGAVPPPTVAVAEPPKAEAPHGSHGHRFKFGRMKIYGAMGVSDMSHDLI
jgi:hypothetical protein